jgi:uncharacterized cupredoxin-like copper-binding protein
MRIIGLATLIALLMSVSLLGSSTPASADATVAVSMTEFAVSPSVSSVAPGTITFNVSNNGAIIHDLHVIQTDLPPDQLPVDSGTGQVDTAQVPDVASTGIIQGGGSDSTSQDLPIASYVLICNVPSHYEAGMYAGFQVQPAAAPTNTPAGNGGSGNGDPTDDGTGGTGGNGGTGGTDDGGTGGTGGDVDSPTTGYGPNEQSNSMTSWLLVVPVAGAVLFFGCAAFARSRRAR